MFSLPAICPDVTEVFLTQLFDAAEASDADCVVPEIGGKIDPLCAVYHRRLAVTAVDPRFIVNCSKCKILFPPFGLAIWPVPDPAPLDNVNTPAEWSTR